VTSTSPVDGETGVILDGSVQVQFSKPVDPGTVSLSGLPGVDANPSWNDDFTTVEFSHGNLSHGQTYQVTVNADDNFGNALGDGLAPRQWSFVASTDNVPPDVTISIVEERVGEGDVEPLVLLTFDDAVRTDIHWRTQQNRIRRVTFSGIQRRMKRGSGLTMDSHPVSSTNSP